MFNSDKPIESAKEDTLKRATFSKQLANAILSYTAEDNFTIGLCGEWGCGKTSILNMVIQEMKILTEKYDDDKKPIIVQFNPWNYSDRDQLLSQFFQSILAKLKNSNDNGKLKDVGTALQKYSIALEYTAFIPVVGKYLNPLKTILSNVGKHIKEISEAKEDIAAQKEVVIKSLKGQKQKIMVVIDDIDRLNNEQIRLIFQLVNSLAGFPNMIYVLSFDKRVVVRALEKEQNCKGEDYLEKIIQVPFEVPIAKKSDVYQVFFDKIDSIFKEIHCSDFDNDYWGRVFHNCIAYFIKSIRDINRIINVYRLKYGLMHNETNCVDLLVITILQIYAPRIASWISMNNTTLTGSISSAGGTTGMKQKEQRDQYYDLFKSIYPTNPDLMLDIIQTLFPRFGWKTGGYNYSNDTDEELRRKQRIAHSKCFDYYFNLSLEDIIITKEEMLSTIYDMNDITLRNYLDALIEKSYLTEYLTELRSYINDIPSDRLALFYNELLNLQSIRGKHNNANSSAPVSAYQCKLCIYEILRRMDNQTRFNTISTTVINSNFDIFSFVSELLLDIEHGYGKIGDYTEEKYQLISEDQLIELEKKYLETTNRLLEVENLLDTYDFHSISILWRFLDVNSYKEYVNKQLLDTSNVLKYLYLIATHWKSADIKGWTFKEKNFEEFINKDEANTRICELKGTSTFSNLPFHIKQICIAFYVWSNMENVNYRDISERKVEALIPEWEAVHTLNELT